MKKAYKSFVSIIIMLTIAVCTASSANAASSNKANIYSFLTKEIGFNSASACGIMANIEKESNFNPSKVITDSNGLPSGGLCQWNGSRFSNLKKYCNNNGYDYLSITGQLKYLEYELQKKSYKHIYDYLMSVENTSRGAYDAAYYWCYYFEVPASRSKKAVTRGNLAQNTYWKKYADAKLDSFKLSSKKAGDTIDMNSSIVLTWSSAGSNAQSYTVYIAKKTNGEYNWKKAEKKVLSAKTQKYTVKLSDKGIGSYKAYILAESLTETKKSNTISFKVDCLKHDYTSKIVKKATSSSAGTKKYTCQKCGYSYKNSYTKVTSDSNIALKSISLKVSSVSATSIKLSSKDLKGADGFVVYKYNGKKWVKAATSEKKSITLSGLKPGKTYSLKFRSYSKSGSKTIYSKYTSLKVATAPKDTYIKTAFRKSFDKASLTWDKVDGASGYVIYMSTQKNGDYKKVKTITSGNTTSCNIDGLKIFAHYYFKIKAYRQADDNTAYSTFSNAKYVF